MSAIPHDAMIRTVDVRVDYGDVVAVRDMDLSIGPGEVYGLIGPNGAGKTSTIKVLATLLEPTYGEVFIGGFDVAEQPQKVHELLGYMPDMAPVYEELKCWEFLDLFAHAYGVPRPERMRMIDRCLDEVDLTGKRNTLAGSLSRGMTQRLVLAKTLLHDPKVLLLDEPASGLDPRARIDLRDTLKRLGAMGRTVLISSHILTELAGFCTSYGIMEKGEVVWSGRIDDVAHKRQLVIDVVKGMEIAKPLIEGLDGAELMDAGESQLVIGFDGSEDDAADLLALLVSKGVRVRGYTEKKMGIEDIFMQVGAKEVS